MRTTRCLTKIFVSGSKSKSKKLQWTHHARDEPYEPYDAVYGHMMTAFYGVDPYRSCTVHFFLKSRQYGYSSHHTDAVELSIW